MNKLKLFSQISKMEDEWKIKELIVTEQSLKAMILADGVPEEHATNMAQSFITGTIGEYRLIKRKHGSPEHIVIVGQKENVYFLEWYDIND